MLIYLLFLGKTPNNDFPPRPPPKCIRGWKRRAYPPPRLVTDRDRDAADTERPSEELTCIRQVARAGSVENESCSLAPLSLTPSATSGHYLGANASIRARRDNVAA